MSFLRCGIIIGFFLSIFCMDAIAQRGSHTYEGSIRAGLANIGTTLRSNDAIFSNLANVALSDSQFGISLGSQNRFQLSEFTTAQIGGYYALSDYNFVSLSISSYGFSDYKENKISAAFTRKLMDNLALSANFDYNQTSISEHGQTSYLTYGIGLAGNFSKRISYGVYAFNFQNNEIAPSSDSNAFIQLGVSNKVTDKLTLHGEAEKYIDENLNIKIGVNYRLHPSVALRLGYYTDPGAFSFGFSYFLSPLLQIDMAAQYDILLGTSPSISLQYRGSK